MKFELTETSNKPGGRTTEKKLTFDATENELALMAKCSPLMDKFIGEFMNKMADEQTRHHKAFEDLENRRFDYSKERDAQIDYWKEQNKDLSESLSKVEDKLRNVESELWDWEHGLKTTTDDNRKSA